MGTVRIAAEAGALVASSMTARAGVPAWDEALFRRINALPGTFAPVVWAPMQAGALGAPIAVGAVLLLGGRRREAARTVVTGVAVWGIAKGVKHLVGRGRPRDHIETTELRMGSADNGLGYPSGHAAVVVAVVAGVRSNAGPAWGAAGLALGLAVGFSRVYVGAHYPLDVLGGYALGALTADTYRSLEAMVAGR